MYWFIHYLSHACIQNYYLGEQMQRPISKKWNPLFYKTITKYLNKNSRIFLCRLSRIKKGLTMPDLRALEIGSARRMDVAILFFDLKNFTVTSSSLSNDKTLFILNTIVPTLTRIIQHWGGTIEKNTGDGIMAILGTETRDSQKIAQEAIESAMAIRYMMLIEIQKIMHQHELPAFNFRIGIDMGEVLVSRIGIKNMNFITVVGDAANRASKLQSLSRTNSISIGENLATNLDGYLHQYLEEGTDLNWQWEKVNTGEPYRFFHYTFDYLEPKEWLKVKFN